MNELQIIRINNKDYYLSDDVKALHESFFANCGNGTRQIVAKHSIHDRHVFYVKKEGDEWVSTVKNNKRTGKLLLSTLWVEKNVPGFGEIGHEDVVPIAPSIIILTDNEKFTNEDGDIIEVEVRGTRNVNGCFFKLKDISIGFGMPNLHSTVINTQRDGYIINEHYTYFKCKSTGRNTRKKTIFLTYAGLMRVMYASTSDKVKLLTAKTNKAIYTAHMGTQKQKETVAGIMGVTPSSTQEIPNKFSDAIHVLYKIDLGTAYYLREIYDIPVTYDDDMIISKIGRTKNITRRLEEHTSAFKQDGIEDIYISYTHSVDSKNAVAAETQLLFEMKDKGYKLNVPHHNELIIHDKSSFGKIKKMFSCVVDSFGSSTNSEKIAEMKGAMVVQKMIVEHMNEVNKLKETIAELKETNSELKEANSDLKIENVELKMKYMVSNNKVKDLEAENKKLLKRLDKYED